MVKVVVVNGRPGCGKTTFEEICKNLENKFSLRFDINKPLHCSIMSTVDIVKDIAYICGWDGTKTSENRKMLSDLKDYLTQCADLPFKSIKSAVKSLEEVTGNIDTILFVDSREPAEIQRFKDEMNATTVLIRRPEVENIETSNHADAEVFNFNYDLTIWNNSDIINLENEAEKFLEYMKGAPHYEYDN
jgi:dephospho-CoA kinase